MNLRHFVVLVIISTTLVLGCTSESKLKKMAVAEVKSSFETKIKTESKRIRTSEQLAEAFKSTVASKTTYEVIDIRVEGSSGRAQVEVQTVPYEARRVLVEILDRSQANSYSFNVPDALRLVREQLKIKEEVELEAVYSLKFQNVSGQWKLTGFSSSRQ